MRGDPGGHQPAPRGHRCRTGPHSGPPLWGAAWGHGEHRGGTGSTMEASGAPWGHWEHRGGIRSTMGGTGSTAGGTVGAPVVSSSVGFGVPPVRASTPVWGAHSVFAHPSFGVPPRVSPVPPRRRQLLQVWGATGEAPLPITSGMAEPSPGAPGGTGPAGPGRAGDTVAARWASTEPRQRGLRWSRALGCRTQSMTESPGSEMP